ncbi:hypothetical protein CEXT_737501 [Caerostris extrusa]|uniref:Uncharacterized protein n=1 Tax=Caerostris extrusa TaxID=172846 RepID=A0AAV4MZN0_CAEEX|nr:hypothetical protein CEXT_737501 [Caerostris extrusa]
MEGCRYQTSSGQLPHLRFTVGCLAWNTSMNIQCGSITFPTVGKSGENGGVFFAEIKLQIKCHILSRKYEVEDRRLCPSTVHGCSGCRIVRHRERLQGGRVLPHHEGQGPQREVRQKRKRKGGVQQGGEQAVRQRGEVPPSVPLRKRPHLQGGQEDTGNHRVRKILPDAVQVPQIQPPGEGEGGGGDRGVPGREDHRRGDRGRIIIYCKDD